MSGSPYLIGISDVGEQPRIIEYTAGTVGVMARPLDHTVGAVERQRLSGLGLFGDLAGLSKTNLRTGSGSFAAPVCREGTAQLEWNHLAVPIR